jgi:riboflavin synthase
MFTGLVQDRGIVRALDWRGDDLRAEIETQMTLAQVQMGASICCSGVCLTVVDKSENTFFVDVSQETLRRSMIGAWKVMNRINLEPSLKMGDELGGHFVFGHVDAVTEVLDIRPEGGSYKVELALPEGLEHLVAEKGSVALDGVSLTVNNVSAQSFDVNIIPHTWEKTTLGILKAGDKVNFESDMLARYVARMVNVR